MRELKRALVNKRGASGEEIKVLAEAVQQVVLQKFGITLEYEPLMVLFGLSLCAQEKRRRSAFFHPFREALDRTEQRVEEANYCDRPTVGLPRLVHSIIEPV